MMENNSEIEKTRNLHDLLDKFEKDLKKLNLEDTQNLHGTMGWVINNDLLVNIEDSKGALRCLLKGAPKQKLNKFESNANLVFGCMENIRESGEEITREQLIFECGVPHKISEYNLDLAIEKLSQESRIIEPRKGVFKILD